MWLVVLWLLCVCASVLYGMVNYSQPLTMWQITVNYEYGGMVSGRYIFVCFLGVVTCINLQAWHLESNCS